MEFADEIPLLARRINELKDSIKTEEATKMAFVVPFIKALGYDVFNPSEVIPEFTADVGTKKGEKVDYAIKIKDRIVILIECKSCYTSISEAQYNQLFRYFSVTEAKFAILTNGIIYWIFTDTDSQNKMDSKPFLEFDMLNYKPRQIEELKKFSVNNFDVDAVFATANDLKYNSIFSQEIAKEIDSPSEEFIKMIIGRARGKNPENGGTRKITAGILAKFTPLVQTAMKDTIRDLVNQKLSSALDETTKPAVPQALTSTTDSQDNPQTEVSTNPETSDEMDAFNIVRAILRARIKASRITLRKKKHSASVLLDDTNRKPICRFYFDENKKRIGIITGPKEESEFDIHNIDDIFEYAQQLEVMASLYDSIKLGKIPASSPDCAEDPSPASEN